jgi:hypothetical protein
MGGAEEAALLRNMLDDPRKDFRGVQRIGWGFR